MLIGRRLADLGDGVRVGTGSPAAGDAAARLGRARRASRCEVVPIRGNVDTRIGLAARGDVDAVVLAAAGLRRLGYLADARARGVGAWSVASRLPAEILDHAVMLPAPGQGALALETSTALDADARAAVAALDDPVARAEVQAERGFLAALEAGCTAPVGSRAVVKSVRGTSADLTLTAVIGRTSTEQLGRAPYQRTPSFDSRRTSATSEPWDFGV